MESEASLQKVPTITSFNQNFSYSKIEKGKSPLFKMEVMSQV